MSNFYNRGAIAEPADPGQDRLLGGMLLDEFYRDIGSMR